MATRVVQKQTGTRVTDSVLENHTKENIFNLRNKKVFNVFDLLLNMIVILYDLERFSENKYIHYIIII